MNVYQQLGVRRVINAEARLTRLGGSLMPEAVRHAMDEAARWYVDIGELQQQVGQRIAELTRNEAAYVCSGAAAGLFISVLACMDEDASALAAKWPVLGEKREIIMHCAHRIPYDVAIRQTGVTLVQIGNALTTSPRDLETAITERTAAVVYVAGDHLRRGALSLAETVRIAHDASVPVIVDAAAQLPPPENLWRFTRGEGADLVVFSGGKDLCGPQASGLILGRADLIGRCADHCTPLPRLARAMKIGKEEIIGVLAALERYLKLDHTARMRRFEQIVSFWVESLQRRGLDVRRAFPNEAGQPVPWVRIELDSTNHGYTGSAFRHLLWEGNPRIAVGIDEFGAVYLTPDTIEDGDEQIILDRIQELLHRRS